MNTSSLDSFDNNKILCKYCKQYFEISPPIKLLIKSGEMNLAQVAKICDNCADKKIKILDRAKTEIVQIDKKMMQIYNKLSGGSC